MPTCEVGVATPTRRWAQVGAATPTRLWWYSEVGVTIPIRLLEQRLESHQIEAAGIGFVDFWSQRQKVIKSILLGVILRTSGAKASESLNQGS